MRALESQERGRADKAGLGDVEDVDRPPFTLKSTNQVCSTLISNDAYGAHSGSSAV